ncbi:MEDS domain-containing protein [Neobacillus terrae]|uniref:MEDS domain-containing protein n=1 Tax=Neobacillus terrae TaxID=3034837 RepID=UPI001407B11A|nr:MEDS domain-containing protein [Neobacillus terrae]NHM32903.1 3-ketoacyl-ACP reductase [Neobacillus terrae]
MDKKISQLANHLEQSKGVHVFYYSCELESYIQNAVSYIISGIEQEDYIIMIENERIYPLIYKRMEMKLTEEQLKKIRFFNNLKFYWLNNNFYPQTILSYFSEVVNPYMEKNMSIRTWGHVEWGDRKDFETTLEEFENAVNKIVGNMKVITVCAYNAERVSDTLKEKLMKHHAFFMTDNDIIPITENSSTSNDDYKKIIL